MVTMPGGAMAMIEGTVVGNPLRDAIGTKKRSLDARRRGSGKERAQGEREEMKGEETEGKRAHKIGELREEMKGRRQGKGRDL